MRSTGIGMEVAIFIADVSGRGPVLFRQLKIVSGLALKQFRLMLRCLLQSLGPLFDRLPVNGRILILTRLRFRILAGLQFPLLLSGVGLHSGRASLPQRGAEAPGFAHH